MLNKNIPELNLFYNSSRKKSKVTVVKFRIVPLRPFHNIYNLLLHQFLNLSNSLNNRDINILANKIDNIINTEFVTEISISQNNITNFIPVKINIHPTPYFMNLNILFIFSNI